MLECAKHCAMASKMVITQEQVAGERLIIEVIGEIPHHLLKVVAAVNDFSCEIFPTVIHTHIGIVHIIQVLGAVPFKKVINGLHAVFVAQLALFSDFVKSFFAHALVI